MCGLEHNNKKMMKQNKEINMKAASYKKGMELMTERFEEEKRQKESAWNIGDKVKNRIIKTVMGTKLLKKENDELMKKTSKLNEEKKCTAREYENKALEQKNTHEQEMKRVHSKTKNEVKRIRNKNKKQ